MEPQPAPDVTALVEALREVTDDLEAEINARLSDDHQLTLRAKSRDMEPAIKARAVLAALEASHG
jgi:hypothetical protein